MPIPETGAPTTTTTTTAAPTPAPAAAVTPPAAPAPTVSTDNTAALTAENQKLKQELEVAKKTPILKSAFKKAGGKKESWNDFLKLHNSELMESKDVTATITELQKTKKYFFNEGTNFNSNREISKNFAKEDDDDKNWVGGTLIKIKKIKTKK